MTGSDIQMQCRDMYASSFFNMIKVVSLRQIVSQSKKPKSLIVLEI